MTTTTQFALRRVEKFRDVLTRYEPSIHVVEETPTVDEPISHTGFQHLTRAVAVIPMPDREQLLIGGRDHRKVLQGLLSNDVVGLDTGQGCHAALLTDKGKMQTDVRVAARTSDLLLELPYERVRWFQAQIDKYVFREKVTYTPHDEDRAAILLAGPALEAMLGELGLGLPSSACGWGQGRLGDVPIDVTRANWFGDTLDAVTVWVPVDKLDAVLGQLIDSARTHDGGLAGFETFELGRLAAGMPRFPHDLNKDSIPLEATQLELISFTKGCYLGQEIIARVDSRGAVNRQFVAFDVHQRPLPQAGTRLLATEGSKVVGCLTTVGELPGGRGRALGWIRRAHTAAGTVAAIEGGGTVEVRPSTTG